jgi:ribosomal protein S18 acetylase RimI-like enzyme
MKSIKIEQASEADSEEILRIQKSAFQSEAKRYNNFNIPPLVQTLDSVITDFSKFDFYKAIFEEKIVGAIKVQLIGSHKLWIGRLVVDPDYQHKGIGRSIMAEMERIYSEVTLFELFTGGKSKQNIQFYETLGYQIKEYFHEPEHADIMLVKMAKHR